MFARNVQALAIVGFLCFAAAAAAAAEVKVNDTGYTERKSGDVVYMTRDIVLDTGKALFRLRTNGNAVGLVGGNWHSGELCTVIVNGERFFGFSAEEGRKDGFEEKTSFKVTPGEEVATVEAVQKGNRATVKLTLTARAGDDKLGLAVKVEPIHRLRGTIVGFECYPSTMVPRDKLKRAVATTMRRQVKESADSATHFTMDEGERWAFFYDDTYDLNTPTQGNGKGQGGCALFFVPEEVRRANIALGPLHIDPRFYFGPRATEMHFTVIDFRGKLNNADAIEALKALEEAGHVPGKKAGQ